MKKFIFGLIAIIIILLAIIILKSIIPITKYSNEDVNNLILKGLENMDNMSNISFEIESSHAIYKYYYKGNKMKQLVIKGHSDSGSEIITDLDEEKMYGISHKSKSIIVLKKASSIDKGIQYELARLY